MNTPRRNTTLLSCPIAHALPGSANRWLAPGRQRTPLCFPDYTVTAIVCGNTGAAFQPDKIPFNRLAIACYYYVPIVQGLASFKGPAHRLHKDDMAFFSCVKPHSVYYFFKLNHLEITR